MGQAHIDCCACAWHPGAQDRGDHVRAAVRGLVNLNVHFHLVVPDGVFVDDENRLAFALHPVPTSADVVAILERIVRRIARRLADEARDDSVEEGGDVLAQVQAEAAATWRSPGRIMRSAHHHNRPN